MVGNRSLWLSVAWFALSACPALAYRACGMPEAIFTWGFGAAYLVLLPLLAFSLGMGWRTFSTTIATFVWVVCADLWLKFILSGDASGAGDCSIPSILKNPIEWTTFLVFVALGGFFAMLLHFIMPLVLKLSSAFYLRISGVGWLHLVHAVFLVCVLCLAMGTMVLGVVSARSQDFSYADRLDMRDRLTLGMQPVGFA